MNAKLGFRPGLGEGVTWSRVEELWALLPEGQVDYTSIFRGLGKAARGHCEPAGSLFRMWVRLMPGLSAGVLWARTPTRWTGSVRCIFPATTW